MILRLIILFTLLAIPTTCLALDFSLHKNQGLQPGPTLLVIGGIQGDEPGGFNAAALLATHYRVDSGKLWVVPNLNFSSIIKRTRGLHGDMNRKFAKLPKSDPEYHQVERIKSIIQAPEVDLVFNLHDGSGFYHPDYVDPQRNPDRWGQSCIIDQSELTEQRFGNLEELTRTTVKRVNQRIFSPEHYFQLKNTQTASTDTDMKQSLTYFAVRQQKPAFGIEASKNFSTHMRAYYHLLAMEAYMEQVGLRFTRDFELTPGGVKQALKENVRVSFGDGRIQFEVNNLRKTLKYFPLQKNAQLQFSSNNPLVAVMPNRDRFRIHYGNNRLAFLKPQYFEYDKSLDGVEMLIDGKPQRVNFGATVPVSKNFLVRTEKGYRVNVIGFFKQGQKNEKDLKIDYTQIREKYSIDKGGKVFRIEVYKKNRFSGMVLVDFRPQPKKQQPLVVAATQAEQQSAHPN